MKNITFLLASLLLTLVLTASAQAGFLTEVPSDDPLEEAPPAGFLEEEPPPSSCSAAPVFTNVEVGPEELWAPVDRDVDIHVFGKVSVDPGCVVTGEYSFVSNAGLVNGVLDLAEDGSFEQTLTVKVSRGGQDKNGRTYLGLLTATDSEGSQTTQSFTVTVAHDKGQKLGQNK